jgi:GntR family transcriptional regulator, transcriptional repressor for pyruvate dehydrogenase complex
MTIEPGFLMPPEKQTRKSKRTPPPTVARKVSLLLREEAFKREHNERLGSEDDLVKQFNVSRPTFRQAAKILEQEQLLKIKRGVNGGYFVQRPTSTAVAHMTAIYLHSRHATLRHLITSAQPLYTAMVVAAANGADPEQTARLAEFAEQERATLDQPAPLSDYLRSEARLGAIFYRLGANPVLNLFLEIIIDLSALQTEGVWAGHPERIAQYRRLRLKLAEAILAGDEEVAAVAARRCTAAIEQWFEADHFSTPERIPAAPLGRGEAAPQASET